MSNRGMNALQTQCAMDMKKAAAEEAGQIISGVNVRFDVAIGKEGNLDLQAHVKDTGQEDPELVLYCLGEMGVSSAVICDGAPIDPRELLQ